MRFENRAHPLAELTEVGVHLTSDEAREMIAVLTDLLDDIGRIGLSASHAHLSYAEREIGLFLYSGAATLENDFIARIAEDT